MSDQMCVRLWPVNERQGRTVANYTYKGQKYNGGLRPQWYICGAAMAAELGKLRVDDSNPTSPTIFQVVTPEEKAEIEQRENVQYLAQIGILQGAVSIPGDVQAPVTRDLREPEPEPEPEAAPEPAGRAAALPPPRQPTSSVTETGAVTSEDTPKGETGHRSSWNDDEDE